MCRKPAPVHYFNLTICKILFCLPCSQPEKWENAVPFATGIFWKLKPEFLVEWKVPSLYA